MRIKRTRRVEPDPPKTIRGVCDHCGQRDDVFLAFDQIHYLCANMHACLLRVRKAREAEREKNVQQD